jgi:hypothetical protein
MMTYNWSDFLHLSESEQKKLLSSMRQVAKYKGGIDSFMYNRYAEQFHMKKI